MVLESGTLIGRYTVLSPIGAGGMGEVYLAEDTRLGRRVALKLLSPGFTRDQERVKRFEQEARAISSLNHPNIMTIYETGEADSARFIATEFIEGETLRNRLGHGPLPLGEVLDIAIQTAGALAAAHQSGIIHRDIKPENIMLRPDGYVKVLDFGIAKLTEKFVEQRTMDTESHDAASSATIAVFDTESNVVLGSPSYMSPEQARGLKVDGRTDVFSLGVIIYEMLAGRRPFEGPTLSDVIVQILDREPPPLRQFSPEISPRLERIVERALQKDREQRYQTIGDLLNDLRRQKRRLEFEAGLEPSVSPDLSSGAVSTVITPQAGRRTLGARASATAGDTLATRNTSSVEMIITEIRRHRRAAVLALAALVIAAAAIGYVYWGRGSQAIDSLAVLPFENLEAGPDAEYLSDGITESLIQNLSQSSNLKVMSRNSVFRYKGRQVDAREVGSELGVRAVLTGRIVRRGSDLTISIELVDARDNSHIWGEQYGRKVTDLLSVQQEIARQISEKLRLRLTGDERRRLTRRYTDNAAAYEFYLRGRYHWNKRTEDEIRRGIEFFKQAIEADPGYALAYAGLSDCYALLIEYGSNPPAELYPLARRAAEQALEIDGTLAEAYNSLAAVNEYDWKWAEAENHYKRAIELNPNYATAHHWYGVFLANHSRADEALREIRRAQELDPLSLIINTSVGRVLYSARLYDRAIEQLRRTLDMEPNFAEARFHLGLSYEAKRMYDEAIGEFKRSAELFNDKTMVAWVGRAHALAGRRGEAERVLAEVEALGKTKYVSPYLVAIIHAALGEKDKAFEWLEKDYRERSYYVVWLKVDPVFDPLRADPRFQDLLGRIGLPQ